MIVLEWNEGLNHFRANLVHDAVTVEELMDATGNPYWAHIGFRNVEVVLAKHILGISDAVDHDEVAEGASNMPALLEAEPAAETVADGSLPVADEVVPPVIEVAPEVV